VIDKLLSRRKKSPPDPEPMRRFEQNVSELLAAVKEITAKQQLEDIQYELARITNLIPNLRNCDHLDRVAHLKLAVAALGADKPNLEFARAIRQDSEFLIQRTQRGMFRFVYRFAGTTPLSATLAGVASSGVAMVLVAAVVYLASWLFGVRIENLRGAAGLALMMAVFAAIASFVSVITRLADVAKTRDYDPFLIFATGFFKPWVGVTFALFIFTLLESQFLHIGPATANDHDKFYLYLSLAFVSGFSERLVSDFITRTETQISGPAPVTAPTATSHRDVG
jgi:hypothetical protein